VIRRAFLEIAGRAVHYRRAGEGPPVVMLHGSPGDTQMLLDEIAACAKSATVFALDAPGFGYSDPLPGETLTVPDLAAATAEAMRALNLPPCPVYGTHTGAAIAIELGLGWPDQVTGLVMEGLPAFTEAEIEALFTGYFAPMVPDPLGGHLISTWMRFRDQFTWFPWRSRDVRRLNALDRPDPASIDLWVSMFYRSCKTYRPAYRAACHYGQAAIRAAESLRVPAIYMATPEDMLFPHLDRLPPLRPNQRIVRLPPADNHARIAAIAQSLTEFAAAAPAPPHRQMQAATRQLIDGPHGQIFLRRYGDQTLPPLLLLHDTPGTSLALHETALSLAATHHVLIPDHPGIGLTDAPDSADILTAAGDNLLTIAQTLALGPLTIAAAGTGAAIAAMLAQTTPDIIKTLLVADLPPPIPAKTDAIAPELHLSPTGAHWVQAWLMLRDNQIYRPWHDGRIAAQRPTQGNFDAAWLHDQTAALMEARATQHRLPRAAAAFPTAKTLATLNNVTLLPDDAITAGHLAAYL
jgi:pimeloyl-ACP methyl ester carboxylesterase